MTDHVCTQCDGRGFNKPKDGTLVTALSAIDRCTTCGGYGRVSEPAFSRAVVTTIAVMLLIAFVFFLVL